MANTMKLNLRQTVADFLRAHAEQRYTARDLALWIFANHREACEAKRAQSLQDLSDDADLLQQLVREIVAQRSEIQKRIPQIRTTETRPRRYYYTSASEAEEVAQAEGAAPVGKPETSSRAILEHDLYPLLCRYLHIERGLFPKRIDEKRSSNRHGPRGNQWLFPDLVALENLGAEWDKEIRACVKEAGSQRARLWSFEVKRLLNRSNVREAWFQAVSNSSWANFGYLVAAEVEGEDTMKELELLAAAHGIGLIVLDVDNPVDSEIRIPARERSDVDWSIGNRLAQENADFLDFVSWVRQFHQTDNAKVGDWDLPATDD
jgi:hypothetical protein